MEHRVLYLMFLPVLAYYIVFRYWPIFYLWVISFKELNIGSGIWESPWNGFQNFTKIFGASGISRVIRNSIEISFLRILFGFLPPIILAIMFHDMTTRVYKKVTQTIVYIPHFFSWVIIYGIAFAVFSTGNGLINNIIVLFGGERVEFFLSRGAFRPILIGTAIYKELGWGTILYLAALSTVDPQLYDAAIIDGAGPIKRIRHISIPTILPVISFVLCLNLGFILYAGGEQVLLFYNPVVYDVADIIDTWIYRVGLSQLQLSIGTAMGLFQAFFGMITVIIANYIAKRYTGRGIW